MSFDVHSHIRRGLRVFVICYFGASVMGYIGIMLLRRPNGRGSSHMLAKKMLLSLISHMERHIFRNSLHKGRTSFYVVSDDVILEHEFLLGIELG